VLIIGFVVIALGLLGGIWLFQRRTK